MSKSIINNRNLTILSAAAALAVAFGCARQGSPTGGPKDTLPPEVVGESPANRITGFAEKKISITFNEFIQLKDPSKEIFISPPMKVRPDFKAQGKNVVIQFNEELRPDATYTLNFGNSIVDLTEANPIVNYEYVFSTGDHVDSLQVSGLVLNAFTLQPEPDIIAMVYMDDNDTIPLDSLPLKVAPKSASRTLKDGSFRINNLPAGRFLLFALQDLNNNYYFDLPNEKIAFLDSLISVNPPPAPVFYDDGADTTGAEVINPLAAPVPEVRTAYRLYLFETAPSSQKIFGRRLSGENLLTYQFRLPVDTFSLTPLNFETDTAWYIEEHNPARDTLNFWLLPGLPDTIRVRMDYGDTLADTSRFVRSRAPAERGARRKDDKASRLSFTHNATGGQFDPGKMFEMKFSAPVRSWDSSQIRVISEADTLSPQVMAADSTGRTFRLDAVLKEGLTYRVVLDDSAFTDIYGHASDSVFIGVKVRKPEDFGIFIINILPPLQESPFIIQLLSEKDAVLHQWNITGGKTIRIEKLLPGKYKLKAIGDSNQNGKWDPGNYNSGKLPERTYFYGPGVNIRANWELQEEWKIGED
jgi:uncharacterized protein (DUF2141 family)